MRIKAIPCQVAILFDLFIESDGVDNRAERRTADPKSCQLLPIAMDYFAYRNPDMNMTATAIFLDLSICNFQTSTNGHRRMANSRMKWGIPAAKRDVMGVKGHVPGMLWFQNFCIGWHCIVISVILLY